MTIIEGQRYCVSIKVDNTLVESFAGVSGDNNPVHLDSLFAATTSFGRPIAHGMLFGALISGALATHLPGPGTIYLAQTLQFRQPVYVGEEVTLELEVMSVRTDKPIAVIATSIRTAAKEAVVGEATVRFEKS